MTTDNLSNLDYSIAHEVGWVLKTINSYPSQISVLQVQKLVV